MVQSSSWYGPPQVPLKIEKISSLLLNLSFMQFGAIISNEIASLLFSKKAIPGCILWVATGADRVTRRSGGVYIGA